MIHVDTHVLLWSQGDRWDLIPEPVRQRISDDDVLVSPMVELELAYLHEIGRVASSPAEVLRAASVGWDLRVSTSPFETVVHVALGLTWTRDPFDRLIAAQAITDDAILLTADEQILANLDRAAWA